MIPSYNFPTPRSFHLPFPTTLIPIDGLHNNIDGNTLEIVAHFPFLFLLEQFQNLNRANIMPAVGYETVFDKKLLF